MQRIVDGTLYEGKVNAGAFDVRVWEQNGHREISARPVIEWREVGACPDLLPLDAERDAEWIAQKAEEARERSAKRATQTVRRIIKAEGFDELLTITYRENMQDREQTKLHFKLWVWKMRLALGGEFRYCAAPERQERGAYHWHVACFKLPKHVTHKGVKIEGWRLGTAIWRSIVGKDNGLVFVGGKPKGKGRKAAKRTPAKMAAYVSKYILKDAADNPAESNRYSRSNAIKLRKPVAFRWSAESIGEVISRAAALFCWEGELVVSHRLNRWGDAWWLVMEPDPGKPDSARH